MAHRFRELTRPAWLAKRVRLSLLAVVFGLLAVSAGLALSGNWLVSAQSNDFDAEAEDVSTNGIATGQTADISARFQNLSPSSGPHGGEATFDVSILVEPPTGSATRFSWDDEVFTLDQRRTFSESYTFAAAGTYTVSAEIYDINGQQNGWSSSNRFDVRTETFTVHDPVNVQFSQGVYRVNEGDGEAEVTVTVSQSPSFLLRVPVTTSDGTAVSGQDYGGAGPAAIFVADTTDLTRTVSVPIYDDGVVEADTESFAVRLFSSFGGSSDPRIRVSLTNGIASVVIMDNDKANLGFERGTYQVTGQAGAQFQLCVVENGPTSIGLPIPVHFLYTDPDGALSSGPASPASVTFQAGDRVKCVTFGVREVAQNAEVVFTLTGVAQGLENKVTFWRTTATLTVLTSDQPVGNMPPTVSRVTPTSSSLTLTTGASRTFTARATDPDSNITSYEWTVNGSGVGNSGALTNTGNVTRTYSRTFSSSGTYTVKVTFTDSEGANGSVSWTVNVQDPRPDPPTPTSNSAPTVTIAAPVSPVHMETGETRTFTARATDPNNNLTKWKWVVDKHDSLFDGHQQPEASFSSTGRILRSFSHTFPDDGTYTVTVTFTDSSGESGSEEWRVEVKDPPWVDDKSVTHTCGTDPATPKAGDEFTIVSEVTAGEDLDDVFVRFDFSDPVRGMYDRARTPENSSMDISAGDTVRLTAPGIVSHGGDGWVLKCTVMREPGFLEGYINNNPRQLAVEEKAVTVSPYSQSSKESAIGKLKSCGPEGGKLEATFLRASHREYTVNAYLYQGGERVWEGSAHKDAGTQLEEITLVFADQPELEGEYGLDCELTTKYYYNEPSIAFLLRIPTCVSDPFTFTLCAVVLAYELATQWELIDAESSNFCVGGYPGCPFTFDAQSDISPPSVRVGEPVTLKFRTSGLNGVADHGGVTVSFPDLTDVGTTSSDYDYVSDRASVSTVSYTTGTSNVTYHRPGASVQTVRRHSGHRGVSPRRERRQLLAKRRGPYTGLGSHTVGAGNLPSPIPVLALSRRQRRVQA